MLRRHLRIFPFPSFVRCSSASSLSLSLVLTTGPKPATSTSSSTPPVTTQVADAESARLAMNHLLSDRSKAFMNISHRDFFSEVSSFSKFLTHDRDAFLFCQCVDLNPFKTHAPVELFEALAHVGEIIESRETAIEYWRVLCSLFVAVNCNLREQAVSPTLCDVLMNSQTFATCEKSSQDFLATVSTLTYGSRSLSLRLENSKEPISQTFLALGQYISNDDHLRKWLRPLRDVVYAGKINKAISRRFLERSVRWHDLLVSLSQFVSTPCTAVFFLCTLESLMKTPTTFQEFSTRSMMEIIDRIFSGHSDDVRISHLFLLCARQVLFNKQKVNHQLACSACETLLDKLDEDSMLLQINSILGFFYFESSSTERFLLQHSSGMKNVLKLACQMTDVDETALWRTIRVLLWLPQTGESDFSVHLAKQNYFIRLLLRPPLKSSASVNFCSSVFRMTHKNKHFAHSLQTTHHAEVLLKLGNHLLSTKDSSSLRWFPRILDNCICLDNNSTGIYVTVEVADMVFRLLNSSMLRDRESISLIMSIRLLSFGPAEVKQHICKRSSLQIVIQTITEQCQSQEFAVYSVNSIIGVLQAGAEDGSADREALKALAVHLVRKFTLEDYSEKSKTLCRVLTNWKILKYPKQ